MNSQTPLTRGIGTLVALGLLSATSGCLDRELTPLTPCLVSGVVSNVSIKNVDKVDILFMVDNSNSMREEQELLRQQFPSLVRILTSGDRDGDGVRDGTFWILILLTKTYYSVVCLLQ